MRVTSTPENPIPILILCEHAGTEHAVTRIDGSSAQFTATARHGVVRHGARGVWERRCVVLCCELCAVLCELIALAVDRNRRAPIDV